jgi:hypothetical protein
MGAALLAAMTCALLVAGGLAAVQVDDRILVLTNPKGLENGA